MNPEGIKTKTVEGKFDFPIDLPFMIHEMPNGKLAFEIVVTQDYFLDLLAKTPECDDFRMLHSDHTWVAYSKKLESVPVQVQVEDPDTKQVKEETQYHDIAIRAVGANPLIALKELRKKLGYAGD